MKKIFWILPAIAMLFAACQPDDIEGEGQAIKREFRLKTFDNYSFAYNADGTVASITAPGFNKTFSYSGKNLTIFRDGDLEEYKITLNKDGFATKIEFSGHTWTIDYSKGFMTKASLDGVQCTSQKISSNRIQYWTAYDRDNDFWRMNEATYLPKVNVGQVQTDWAEAIGLDRWLFEARLLGNTSVNVLESARWTNAGGKDKNTSVYDYEYDVNGCITQEIKYYGEWNELDIEGLRRLESHTFSWEAIPQP